MNTHTMNTLRNLLLIALLLLCDRPVRAQQEIMVSQYMFNGLFLNPAYAGSHPYISASVLHRAQWTGMNGAPTTSMLAVDGPLMADRLAWGLTVVNDRIGVTRDSEVAGQCAYRMRVSDRGRLAFGLKAALSLYTADLGALTYWDASDQVFASGIRNEPVGRFGFGMYYHDDRSFLGFSMPNLITLDDAIAQRVTANAEHFVPHYYLHAGSIHELSEDFDVKPSLLVKVEPRAPVQADVNCNVLYRQRLWLGAGYRTGDGMVAMLEYQVNPHLRMGYAYDLTTSRLRAVGGGSHEVMLGLDLGRDLIRIKTPRYF